MKIRSGFVSNSSSSSFVVAIKPGEAKVKLTFEIDLESLGEGFKTVEAYKKDIEENYGVNLDDPDSCEKWELEKFEKGKVAIEAGKVVVDGSVSNEADEPISQLLYDNPRLLVKAIEESELDIDIIQVDG